MGNRTVCRNGIGWFSLPNDYPRVLPFHAIAGWDFQRAKGLA